MRKTSLVEDHARDLIQTENSGHNVFKSFTLKERRKACILLLNLTMFIHGEFATKTVGYNKSGIQLLPKLGSSRKDQFFPI